MEVFEMRKVRVVRNIAFALMVVAGFAVFSSVLLYRKDLPAQPALAYETSCPEGMGAQDCYEFLQEQTAQIEAQKNQLEGSIAQENTEQMNLYEQISYISSIIEKSTLTIAKLEVAIESNNVEIKILGEEIIDLQNHIDTLLQEMHLLEATMSERTITSYKMTLMSPIEIMLESQDLETMMRRIKYLTEMKKKDRELFTEMNDSKDELEDEEKALAQKRADVQEKRNQIESERAVLAEERKNLESQKTQQQSLLAESQKREQEYLKLVDASRQQQSALDAEISAVIAKMMKSGEIASQGYVPQGYPIGRMGNTGCSSGAHLHFCINNGTPHPDYWYMWGNINPWSGYLTLGPDWGWIGNDGWIYYYIRGNSFQLPIQEPVVITQDFHQGRCIDMASLLGEGAIIYSAHEGTLSKGTENVCGGQYAIVEHPSGYVTSYLHLMQE